MQRIFTGRPAFSRVGGPFRIEPDGTCLGVDGMVPSDEQRCSL